MIKNKIVIFDTIQYKRFCILITEICLMSLLVAFEAVAEIGEQISGRLHLEFSGYYDLGYRKHVNIEQI